MPTAVKTPGPLRAPLVEWRAARIHDPVRRLQYLRAAAESRPPISNVRWRKFGGWGFLVSLVLWASFLIPAYAPSRARARITVPPVVNPRPPKQPGEPNVWPVEKTPKYDLYSNGLRIENEFATPGKPRGSYSVYRLGKTEIATWRTQPSGIVFHSTESHQAPFEPDEVHQLKRLGRNLLEYVRSQQSYHFVIDRFGRVFRVVHESDAANHAGRSVWSDSSGVYLNLNGSFLSVAFESQTDASVPVSAAQIHAAKVLTDMLRGAYGISASNCVTHAQVSVNPSNMRIGYHTDWAAGFPFAELGLPDNYSQPVPSMLLFGFDYDEAFMAAAAGKPWAGMLAAERLLPEQAQASGVPEDLYRQRLRDRYRTMISSAPPRSNEENQDESAKK